METLYSRSRDVESIMQIQLRVLNVFTLGTFSYISLTGESLARPVTRSLCVNSCLAGILRANIQFLYIKSFTQPTPLPPIQFRVRERDAASKVIRKQPIIRCLQTYIRSLYSCTKTRTHKVQAYCNIGSSSVSQSVWEVVVPEPKQT